MSTNASKRHAKHGGPAKWARRGSALIMQQINDAESTGMDKVVRRDHDSKTDAAAGAPFAHSYTGTGSELKIHLEKALKKIDGKLDRMSGFGAYQGERETFEEKRELHREVRRRAKKWLREQEIELRKELVAKYEEMRNEAIQLSHEKLEKGCELYPHEMKRRKEKIVEMIDNNIKRRINIDIERVKIEQWTPDSVLEKVTRDYKKYLRDQQGFRELEGKRMSSQKRSSVFIPDKKDALDPLPKIHNAANMKRNARGRFNPRGSTLGINPRGSTFMGVDPRLKIDSERRMSVMNVQRQRASEAAGTGGKAKAEKLESFGPVSECYKIECPDDGLLTPTQNAKLRQTFMDRGPATLEEFPALGRIVYLSLSNCMVGAKGIKHLSHTMSVFKRLQYLDVSGNSMDSDATRMLMRAIEGARDVPLNTLDLSNNRIGDGSHDGVRGLVSLLRKSSKKIHTLMLRESKLSFGGFKLLVQNLCGNKFLRRLILSDNRVGFGGLALTLEEEAGEAGSMISHIASMLSMNKCLELVDLSGNGIVASGANHLIKALKMNPDSQLKILDVSDNPMGDEGVACMIESIHATNLEGVCFDSCGCTDAGFSTLAKILSLAPLTPGSPTKLNVISLRDNGVVEKGVSHLEAVAFKQGVAIQRDPSPEKPKARKEPASNAKKVSLPLLNI